MLVERLSAVPDGNSPTAEYVMQNTFNLGRLLPTVKQKLVLYLIFCRMTFLSGRAIR